MRTINALRLFSIAISLCLLLGHSALVYAQQRENLEKHEKAQELYSAGYLLTMFGRYEEAIRLFDRSLEILPTAEAYTYKGWTLSHMGDPLGAIEEAKKAIQLDPDFGNPYNDIGVYLFELGKEEEAIPYLEKAMRAKRYCCYQFPYFNLGRIYLKKKMLDKARDLFKKALEIDPGYEPALQGLEVLKQAGVEQT